jgi:hypothetical protein
MNYFKSVLILLSIAFLGCEKEINKPDTLVDPPQLVSSPAEMDVSEAGIDAIPEADAIQIQWELNADLKGYKLYRRVQNEDEYSVIRLFNEKDSLYFDSQNITYNTRYFYCLEGKDKNNNWTEPSDTLDYMLVVKAFNLYQTTGEKMTFHWQFHDFSPEMYYLKLYDDATDDLIWMSGIQPSYTTLEEQAEYNWDGHALKQVLEKNRSYRWRIDVKGPDRNSGSESNWQRFTND